MTKPVNRGAIYRGTLIDIAGRPKWDEVDAHFRFIRDGALIVNHEGKIIYVGAFEEYNNCDNYPVIDFRPSYIFPGFIDTHIHFPQTLSVHSWAGGHLLSWLSDCIFPAEARLAHQDYAQTLAKIFVNKRIASGTTAAVVMGSAFPAAQDALFHSTEQANIRMICGRGIQTCGPDAARALITDEKTALSAVVEEIQQWHNQADGLIEVAIMPRFALSITPYTLCGLAEIFSHYQSQGVFFHTHLSESKTDEIPEVLSTYQVDSYLDIYNNKLPHKPYGTSFVTRRSIFAHGVYLLDTELTALAEAQSSIAHCPNSQLFLGSGTMPWQKTCSSGVTIALGSDIGGGDKWLVPHVANTAVKVHCNPDNGTPVFLSPAQLLYLSTLAGAIAIDHEESLGNFDLGKDADFVIVDPHQSRMLSDQLGYARYSDQEKTAQAQELFTVLMGMEECNITGVYVRGKKITPLE